MDYTYETDVQELTGDDAVVALFVTITEVRTQTDAYLYPDTIVRQSGYTAQRVTTEEDIQRRVVFQQKVPVDRPAPQPRYHCMTMRCGECSGCKAWGTVGSDG